MSAQKATKKPVTVDAWLVTDDQDDNDALLEWLGDSAYLDDDGDIAIETLEGTMTARTGDWIIRGVKGEFYPCKPDIFADTYDTQEESIGAGPSGLDLDPPVRESAASKMQKLYDAILRARARFITAAGGKPPTDEQRAAVASIAKAVENLAAMIYLHSPDGPNKEIALTALEDVQMRANRAIFADGGES